MQFFLKKNIFSEEKNRKKSKKNRKKFPFDLTKTCLCCIVIGLFAGICLCGAENASHGAYPEKEKNLAEIRKLKEEIALLQEEKKVIRKELLETLDKNTMLTGKLKKLEYSAAFLTESLAPVYTGEREVELVESLRTVMQSSVALASASGNLCSELDKILMQKNVQNKKMMNDMNSSSG